MKKIMKNKKYAVILSLCLAMLLGMTTHAALNPASYYKIHLSPYWEGVASSLNGQNDDGDTPGMGGTIDGWKNPVYAGQTVQASIQSLPNTSSISYDGIEWSWIYNGNKVSSSSKYVVPNDMSGKTLIVTAKLLGSKWNADQLLSVQVTVK